MGVTVRFTVDPLVPYVERSYNPSDRTSHVGLSGKLVQVFKISRGTANRWRATGLTLDEADWYADQVGEHPTVLWPEWEAVEWRDDDDLSDLCGAGNWSGIKRHRREGTPLCGACKAFKAAYEAAWRRANPEAEKARQERNLARSVERRAAYQRRYHATMSADRKAQVLADNARRKRRRRAAARAARQALAQDGTVTP